MTRDLVRQSFRTLMRNKRFSAVAIVSLGLAIALNTTMYSVLDAIIRPKLAVEKPQNLVFVEYFGRYRGYYTRELLRSGIDSLAFHDGVTGASTAYDGSIASTDDMVRQVQTLTVAPNYFRVIGIRAARGRLLSDGDMDAPENPVVISDRLWSGLFPDATEFTPRIIWIGTASRTVVGLLPRGSALPGQRADVWQLPPSNELSRFPRNLVRVRDGLSWNQMHTQLKGLASRIAEGNRDPNPAAAGFLVKPVISIQGSLGFHYAVIGSVLAVLLIACANLANLQLARGLLRARELATRAAVGASRADISQLVLESGWLALGGLLLGAILTAWGMHLVGAFVPPSIAEYITEPQMSWRVFLFAIGVTLFALMVVGLAPAWMLSRVDIHQLMKAGAGTGSSRSARRQYGVLVVTEVALALALLASTGLLVRAALYIRTYASSQEGRRNVVSTDVVINSSSDNKTFREWSDRLIQQALTVDSTLSAVTARQIGGQHPVVVYGDDGRPIVRRGVSNRTLAVSPEYLRVMGATTIAGRDFAPGEFAGPQIIVDRNAARTLWPGREAVGQQIKLGDLSRPGPWYRVVGVTDVPARLVLNHDDVLPNEQLPPEFYTGDMFALNSMDTVPACGRQTYAMTSAGSYRCQAVALRVLADPRAHKMPRKLHEALKLIGPHVVPAIPMSWESEIAMVQAPYDFVATMFVVFGVLALGLASLGIYSILSHTVAQRTREIGVRIALGATYRDVREMVLREGRLLTLIGIVGGLILTYHSAWYVRRFVFSDYDRYDSRVFGIIILVLFAVAWLASYIPARRAMRINPVEALRND